MTDRDEETDIVKINMLMLSVLLLLLLLIKRYNLYKFLVCSTSFFQLFLFCATFFPLLMFMLFISSKTSSSQRVLGLPFGLLDTCHLYKPLQLNRFVYFVSEVSNVIRNCIFVLPLNTDIPCCPT